MDSMKKAPMAAMIIATAKKKGNDMQGEEDSNEGKKAAGQALLDAINGEDPMAIVEAISSIVDICNCENEME